MFDFGVCDPFSRQFAGLRPQPIDNVDESKSVLLNIIPIIGSVGSGSSALGGQVSVLGPPAPQTPPRRPPRQTPPTPLAPGTPTPPHISIPPIRADAEEVRDE